MTKTESQLTIEATLKKHFVMWHALPKGTGLPDCEWRCSCGLKFGFSDSAIIHQAEQLELMFRTPLPSETTAEQRRLLEYVGLQRHQINALSNSVYIEDGDPLFAEANDVRGDAVRKEALDGDRP